MSEVKKTKRPASKKPTNSKKPATRSTTTKSAVKETADFKDLQKDTEGEDNKLVVVIALAVLIIVATIIGLLVGCQKQEEEDVNVTTNTTSGDIIIPGQNDENTSDEEEAVKTTSKAETMYEIVYILDSTKHTSKIKKGQFIEKYVPSGYKSCQYYYNEAMTQGVNFSEAPTGDTKVYMSCELKEYTVTYKDASGSVVSTETIKGADTENYKIMDGSDLGTETNKFLGWSRSGDKNIHYSSGQNVKLNGDLSLQAVLGTAVVKFVNVINTHEEPLQESSSSDEVVETPSEDESGEQEPVNEVTVGYTEDELSAFSLPDNPADVGLTVPTYYVIVDEATSTSLVVVADDKEEVGEKEVKLADVQASKPWWYEPQVNDNVEEKECQFLDWGIGHDVPGAGFIYEILDSTYKPTEEETEIHALWDVQDEDMDGPNGEEYQYGIGNADEDDETGNESGEQTDPAPTIPTDENSTIAG